MLYQGSDGPSSAATGVGVSGAMGTIIKGDSRGDQFKMGVFTVHGIEKWLMQWQYEESTLDVGDTCLIVH
tara:strand:- start:136 stop:345 length:210 start_codon:yes stop_codon:yes gene_type:complete